LLPIALVALVMQILAPIAACWATSIAMSDPLQAASICHTGGDSGPDDQNRGSAAHDGLCAMCVSHAGEAVDAPTAHAFVAYLGQVLIVHWPKAQVATESARITSNTRARGPPALA